MASQKLQVGRAWPVIPLDNTDIPFPAYIIDNPCTGFNNNIVQDNTVDFFALGVKPGDIVINTTLNLSAYVINVVNANTLGLSQDNVFTAIGQNYIVYQGGQNNGCVLYIGGAGDVEVETIGHDVVTFHGVLGGQFIPVQVLKVMSATTATNILALW